MSESPDYDSRLSSSIGHAALSADHCLDHVNNGAILTKAGRHCAQIIVQKMALALQQSDASERLAEFTKALKEAA